MSESADGSLWTEKTSLKFITKTKQNQQRFLIHFFPSSKCVKIARLAMESH